MTPNIDDKFLMSLTSDIKLIQKDIKYIKKEIELDKKYTERIYEMDGAKVNDHETRIRNIERVMYKGLGAAVVFSMIISAIISFIMR